MTSPTIGDKLWGYFWDEYDVYPKTLPKDKLKEFCDKKKINYSNSLQNDWYNILQEKGYDHLMDELESYAKRHLQKNQILPSFKTFHEKRRIKWLGPYKDVLSDATKDKAINDTNQKLINKQNIEYRKKRTMQELARSTLSTRKPAPDPKPEPKKSSTRRKKSVDPAPDPIPDPAPAPEPKKSTRRKKSVDPAPAPAPDQNDSARPVPTAPDPVSTPTPPDPDRS